MSLQKDGWRGVRVNGSKGDNSAGAPPANYGL